ncbi:excinuclease ABC subunit UvrC [Kamptonema cortianum]|nr:excinuclease ABC subunit UvrC [Geitlerinema splendidum]MDK3161143.1 excinuclease ABC subunit UvrC [Kamptonema cortianum]
MSSKARTDKVKDLLKKLPAKPGCYIYKDEAGDVLYVGKAISLRSRVRSYFQASSKHTSRIERLVHKIRDIEWIVVDSEVEALVLECNLIKEHRPPYNVRMRDDKSYPFILVTKENFPRVMFTRNPRKGGGKVFGPYTSAYAVRETLQLLHKVFPLIPCGKSWTGKAEQRPCLYYHLGQCLAPCAGLSDKNEYSQVISQVTRFLEGKEAGLIREMESQMMTAAEQEEFELAASIRDRIQSLRSVLERQKVMSEDGLDRDIVAVVKDDRGAAIQMLYIRGGRLIGQQNYMLDGSKEASPTEAVQEFVKQYYATAPEIPREVLLPVEIEEKVIVQTWLRQRRGAAVSVEVPQGGEGLRLVDLAAKNAELALKTFSLELEKKEQWTELAIEQLSEAIDLPTPAIRIEGFDISNIQGKMPVGSMVVTKNGEPEKRDYRRFSIKWTKDEPNDFAMMKEVITRRLRKFLDGDPKFSPLPDLIMIDGGKGQLSAALEARDELGLSVPMVGLAKKQEIIYVPNLASGADASRKEYSYSEVILELNSPGLMLLRKLRDEAHRFAITYHRKLRDKRMHGSVLDEIPGIGSRRRRMLLRTFGSVEAIRQATVEEIAAVPTLTLRQAESIKDYLRTDV